MYIIVYCSFIILNYGFLYLLNLLIEFMYLLFFNLCMFIIFLNLNLLYLLFWNLCIFYFKFMYLFYVVNLCISFI